MNTRIAAGILTLVCTFSASATPVTWQLIDWVFEDGGTASGTFTFDADAGGLFGEFSNVNITTTDLMGGTINYTAGFADFALFPGDTFAFVPTVNPMGDFTGVPILNGIFDDDFFFLSDAGSIGVVDTLFSGEFACSGPNCFGVDDTVGRFLVSGSVSAVPLPAAAWLFITALVGAFGLKRRANRESIAA